MIYCVVIVSVTVVALEWIVWIDEIGFIWIL